MMGGAFRSAGLASVAAFATLTDASAAAPEKTIVASGLAQPWDIAFLSEEEALVTEKAGAIRRVNLRTGEHRAVAGFPGDLDNENRAERGDNSGLFGIVLDPDFSNNGWIYVAYSGGRDGVATLKVIRARLKSQTCLGDVEELLVVAPATKERHHYGGGIVFGPDGKLYVAAGERHFHERDQPAFPVSQNPAEMRGKIYRINADGTIPDDNPDFGPDAVPGLYAIGIRATQGFTLHPETKAIWFSDHGAMQGDEINILAAGANYGWPVVTSGSFRNADYDPPPRGEGPYAAPVWTWAETVAPTGLTFYTGTDIPAWTGDLIVPGLSRGSLWRLRVEGEQVMLAERLYPGEGVRYRKARQSPGGALYLLTDKPDGEIVRIGGAPR